MKVRYLLCPGLVTSRTDGDRHYIRAGQLAALYGVSMADCLVLPDQTPENHRQRMALLDRAGSGELIALWPRSDGNYTLPLTNQREFMEATPINQTVAGRVLVEACHGAAKDAGWWNDPETGEDVRTWPPKFLKLWVGTKLALVHSEVSEGLEGHRKGLQDDKLPHRPMLEVELADAVIRICDLAGGLGFDLGGAIAEKLAFNAQCPDHKPEARQAEGGKSY